MAGLTLQWSPHRLGQSLRFLTQLPLFWSLHQRLWSLGPLLGSHFGSGGLGGAHHGQAICGQLHQLCNVHQRSRHVPRHVTQSNACHKSMQILETSGTPGCQKVSVKTPRQSNMPQNTQKLECFFQLSSSIYLREGAKSLVVPYSLLVSHPFQSGSIISNIPQTSQIWTLQRQWKKLNSGVSIDLTTIVSIGCSFERTWPSYWDYGMNKLYRTTKSFAYDIDDIDEQHRIRGLILQMHFTRPWRLSESLAGALGKCALWNGGDLPRVGTWKNMETSGIWGKHR